MKIICNREKLESAFSLASLAVKAQSPKPILRNIKLDARENELVLFATDMEMGIRIALPCDQVEVPGSVVLPVDRVTGVLRESQDECITIESNGTQTHILGEIRFSCSTEDPDEFPGTPTFEETDCIVTKARYIKEGIRRTIFATDNETGRYALGGVMMDYQDNYLNFVSTDGRRMAAQQVEASMKGGHSEQYSAIATTRALQMLDKILKGDEEVSLALLENQILVQAGNIFFYASLLEGRFPNWRVGLGQIRNPKTIILPTELFTRAIRAAGVVTEKMAPGVVLEFGNGQMTITAIHVDRGRIEKNFPIDFQGDNCRLKLNQEYVNMFLKSLSDDTIVTMNYVDERTGVMFSTNDGYRYLVMPMQLEAIDRKAEETEGASQTQETPSDAPSETSAETPFDAPSEAAASDEKTSESSDDASAEISSESSVEDSVEPPFEPEDPPEEESDEESGSENEVPTE